MKPTHIILTRAPTIDIYRDTRGQWRWRLRAANGRVVADSAEGYAERRGVDRAVEVLRRVAPVAVLRTL